MKRNKRTISKRAAADQHGLFQHFQANTNDYATRDRYLAMRGGDFAHGRDTESLYNLATPGEDSRVPTEYVAPHLSTRYSPDRVGVQARRIADGVYQDPYTKKVYDYNEGFKTEDGRDFPGGAASLQSSLARVASSLDAAGLTKVADSIDFVLRKLAEQPLESSSPDDGPVESMAETTLEEDLEAKDPCVQMEKVDILKALFEAHENPESPYKLSLGRWSDLTPCNLTTEERDIVDGDSDGLVMAFNSLTALSKIADNLDAAGRSDESEILDRATESVIRTISPNNIIRVANSLDERGEHEVADLLDQWVFDSAK